MDTLYNFRHESDWNFPQIQPFIQYYELRNHNKTTTNQYGGLVPK